MEEKPTVFMDSSRYHPDGRPVLFQEQLISQGFRSMPAFPWMLATGATIMTRSGRVQAFPVLTRFFNEWTPTRCSQLDQSWMFRQLVDCLKPAGLAETKAIRIGLITKDYLSGKPPDHWTSVGEYGLDTVLIFTDDKYITWKKDRLPKDKHLVDYVLYKRRMVEDAYE